LVGLGNLRPVLQVLWQRPADAEPTEDLAFPRRGQGAGIGALPQIVSSAGTVHRSAEGDQAMWVDALHFGRRSGELPVAALDPLDRLRLLWIAHTGEDG